jgi:hypothetical protein
MLIKDMLLQLVGAPSPAAIAAVEKCMAMTRAGECAAPAVLLTNPHGRNDA